MAPYSTVERDWLDLFAELVAASPRSLPTKRLVRQLSLTFDAPTCVYVTVREAKDVDRHPLVRFHLQTGRCVPTQIADLAESPEPDAVGDPHQLSLPLEIRAGVLRTFLVGRDERYRPSEMALAVTLWRLLLGLDRQVDAAALDRRPSASAVLGLTPREAAVLTLLGDGLTASAIAHRLTISARTVHKHLERIYQKLGVTDRLEAVLRAREFHLL